MSGVPFSYPVLLVWSYANVLRIVVCHTTGYYLDANGAPDYTRDYLPVDYQGDTNDPNDNPRNSLEPGIPPWWKRGLGHTEAISATPSVRRRYAPPRNSDYDNFNGPPPKFGSRQTDIRLAYEAPVDPNSAGIPWVKAHHKVRDPTDAEVHSLGYLKPVKRKASEILPSADMLGPPSSGLRKRPRASDGYQAPGQAVLDWWGNGLVQAQGPIGAGAPLFWERVSNLTLQRSAELGIPDYIPDDVQEVYMTQNEVWARTLPGFRNRAIRSLIDSATPAERDQARRQILQAVGLPDPLAASTPSRASFGRTSGADAQIIPFADTGDTVVATESAIEAFFSRRCAMM